MKRNNLKSKILKVCNLVNYSDNSVVSYTLIDNNNGTITLFAFDKGQSLSEHKAPFDAVAEVIDGEGIISISGKEYKIASGELIIMPAGKPHSVKARKRFKMILTMIRS
ncbi:MAG: cupin domain-containing protein [Elusimicrobiales bacterium]|jgi:quercetin dioxygenase-like cupin family protein|nr:cupin domain-containing protein [Elusimicrobiales bacterium]NLH39458.1 cupin domain-containing protein [Elusimicrobiota bacterium]